MTSSPLSSVARKSARVGDAGVPKVRRFGGASCRRHPEEAALTVGRIGERLLDGQRGLRLVVGPDVHEIERVRGRLDAVQIELGDLADRLEDRVQLRAEALDLLVGQRKPRQPRDVQNLVASRSPLEPSILREIEAGPFRGPPFVSSPEVPRRR